MTERLAILIATPDSNAPAQVVTPLVHALAARALDAEVEIHFAGPAVRWLIPTVADAGFTTPTREKTVGDFLREAVAAEVRIYACSMARAAWLAADETLLLAAGAAGATAFVARALDPAWQTLTY